MLNDKGIRRFLTITLLLVVFAITVVINTKTPMIGEDYALSLTYQEKVSSSIFDKFGLIYDKVSYQFSNWNSRIGEQLAILFLGFDKTFFNVINSLVFVCLAVLNIQFSLGDLKHISTVKLTAYISFTLMIYYVFLPALGESVFWLTGSTNYLWGLVLLLIFIVPFFRLFEFPTKTENGLPIYYVLIGFLSGMTNENTVPVSITLCLLAIFRLKHTKIPVHYSYYLGVFFHLIGYLVLFFSPSTKIRREYYNQVFGVTNHSILDYLDHLNNILKYFYQYYKVYLLFTTAVLTVLIIIIFRSREEKVLISRNKFISLGILVVLSLGSVIDMIVVPYYEVRSSLFVFFAITSLLIYVINCFYLMKKPLFYFTFIIMSLVWLFTINTMRTNYNTFIFEFNNREAILLSNLGLKKSVVVSKFPIIEDRRLLNTREDYLIFNNWSYSEYYGLEKIEIR